MTRTVDYVAPFPDDLVREASHVVTRRYVRRLLTKIQLVGMTVNLLGFCFAVIYLGNSPVTWGIGILALVVPLYLPLILMLYPRKVQKLLAETCQPESRIELSDDGFSVSAKGRAWSMPWSDFGKIEEYDRYFLFILRKTQNPVVIPSSTMPPEARTLVSDVRNRLQGAVV